ncbi:MAG: LamG-like jellyroll fold domain-containing protein, partial [Cyclobacteriaceae bacterium]
MKTNILSLALLLLTFTVIAQKKSNPQIFTGIGALQQVSLEADPEVQGAQMYLQIGHPIIFSPVTVPADGTTINLRFPWDVPYIPLTFSESTFEVSKGYYSNKIEIKWTIQGNLSKISQFKIYRRLYSDNNADDFVNYVSIATLSNDAYSFDDVNVQGATLYEYKVEAVGVSSIPRKFITYITGIGIRNPTGIVTGNVSFDGGNPVRDVVVKAEPQGTELQFGGSVELTSGSSISIPFRGASITGAATLQAWVKFKPNQSATLFRLDGSGVGAQPLEVNYSTTNTGLTLSVGSGTTFRTHSISGYFPDGNLNGRGDDSFQPVQPELWNNFAHVSVTLIPGKTPVVYLNGRPLETSYLSDPKYQSYTTPIPQITTSGQFTFVATTTTGAVIGQDHQGWIDEVRLWNIALSAERIRTDFKRYLGGNEQGLISYLRCDEMEGKFAYDLSRVGFEFNKNDAKLFNGAWSVQRPTSSQLGILGVTDELGNYIISAIPFKFTGESYTITSLYGVHQFIPAQQLVFIGNGSEVINKIEFKDISSFDFIGKVYYTTDGVFDPIAPVSGVTQVQEAGYNEYRAIINGVEQLVSKGAYVLKDGALYETPTIFSEGANIYIDGNLVFDKDKRPVVTDNKGEFKIKVPIGNHYIEVKQERHGIKFGGRFPAPRADGNDLFDFYENQEAPVTFLDTTRVIVVGRVTGGSVESAKPIGFGGSGLAKEQYTDPVTGSMVTKLISSVNNIGTAKLTLGFLPAGALPGTELKTSFTTNPETGEYRVKLVPLNYTIFKTGGITISSNTGISILQSNEILNLTTVPEFTASEYVKADGSRIFSDPYHFKRSFEYRSLPVLNVERQLSDETITVPILTDGKLINQEISTEGFKYRVYRQFEWYSVDLLTYEEYINSDDASKIVVSKVPIEDIEFTITNNLASKNPDDQILERDNNIPSLSHYRFKAGAPSITSPFFKTLNIRYVVKGVTYDATGYLKEGVIIGGQPEGTTFSTVAPDVPDIILRDPPGSNSFASIEKGTTFTFTEEASAANSQAAEGKITLNLGTRISTSAGVGAEIQTEIDIVNDIGTGINMKVESSDGNSISRSYTFNQTISTSDDPLYVGSDADLYIGNSVNHFYGKFFELKTSDTPPDNTAAGDILSLKNKDDKTIYISKQNAFTFNKKPTNTFFVYSQKFIIENLIPSFEDIIDGINSGALDPNDPSVLKKEFCEQQIRQWKKVIQENERTKWQVINDREAYKDKLLSDLYSERQIATDYLTEIEVLGALAIATTPISPFLTFIGVQTVAEAERVMKNKKELVEKKIALLEAEFQRNISFDAGVGEITRSTETTLVATKELTLEFNTDALLALNAGALLNKSGVQISSSNTFTRNLKAALNTEDTETTKVSYTLKDNDPNNFLSVDVVNAFDGNGPVFLTLGGRTSCPYEAVDSTVYYNNAQYKADSDPFKNNIYDGGEVINTATQRVENPSMFVEIASVTDVPEERTAEFKLIIENNSIARADGNFLLLVDNRTNPNNAIFNLDPNGTLIFVPFGKKTEFALTLRKSIADVYDYKNIRITLASLCDGIIDVKDAVLISQGGRASVFVSASFRPSCTQVKIQEPLENWVFNATDAFNSDNTTNPLKLSTFGYNRNYNSFEKFNLEYRSVTSSSWTRLKTYYNSSALYNTAATNGEQNIQQITSGQSDFSWDIGGLGLADGKYEVRAVSYCGNGTTFISDPIRGTIDLNVPVQFGTPAPTDGILGPGEDLRVRFSEPVFYNSAISKVQIKGKTNQQEIDHAVTVRFDGSQSTMVIDRPNILKGTFTMEFWMNHSTSGSAVIMEQPGTLKVSLASGALSWKFGQYTVTGQIATDQAYHHYTLTYDALTGKMRIYQDDRELAFISGAAGISGSSPASLVIGGNTFVGNIHDLRFWSKPLSLTEAYAAQFRELTGLERDLVGYWPMNEGSGLLARDISRFKNAVVNASWDIKPRGTSYGFQNGQYLILNNVGFVQMTDQMDYTLSFWINTAQQTRGTIFSNGRGNGDDPDQSNGLDNKLAVYIEGGNLYLNSEGINRQLTTESVADNSWHHVSVVLRRNGSLKTFIDARQVSSHPVAGLGGFSGNKIWVGARGYADITGTETIDEKFTGRIDELQLWNLARATEQIDRDRFSEVDFNQIGLLLYSRLNRPVPPTSNGPAYYHVAANETVISSDALLSSGSVSFNDDAPPVRQVRPYLSFLVSQVINGDEMILTPEVSDWSVLEGQIIDITIDRLFDLYANRQASPVTWSAFVRRNELAWFTDEGLQQLEIIKGSGEEYSFTITLVNRGGKQQPYSIQNIPSWLKTNNASGVLDPNGVKKITFTVAGDLTIGQYELDLFLDTDFNFDEKMLLKVRVLGEGPAWVVNPADFEYSMSIIGKVKVNGVFSSDPYSKIAAFAGNQVRGVAGLEYDEIYDEHFVYLPVYSDVSSGETITFKIWDASTGKIFAADVNGNSSLPFVQNEVYGYKATPYIFESTSFIEQYLGLQRGWTWVSLFAGDQDLKDLNKLTQQMSLTSGDVIKSRTEGFDQYDNTTGWSGALSSGPGLKSGGMYKIKLATEGQLILNGAELDVRNFLQTIEPGWNWLSYPLSSNINIREGLAFLEAKEGDVIKSQRQFSVYDPRIGWSGTLRFLVTGEGYMLKSNSTLAQNFVYPDVFLVSGAGRGSAPDEVEETPVADWAMYGSSMSVVARYSGPEQFNNVLVRDNSGTLRGHARFETVDSKQLAFITIFGNTANEEELHFYLGNNDEQWLTNKAVTFIPEQVLGSVRN